MKIEKWRKTAENAKNSANISFDIREDDSDLSYFAMDDLTYLVEPISKGELKKASLHRDAQEYKPIRGCHGPYIEIDKGRKK